MKWKRQHRARKTLSILMVCGVCTGLLGTASAAAETCYTSAIENAERESNAAGMFYADQARGTLYDIDGNGTDELILLYTTKTEQIPFLVSSVYTMDGTGVIPLLEKEPLYAQAGGPSGSVGIAEIDGETLFFVTAESGETGFGAHRGGEWKFYALNGNQLTQTLNITYEYVLDDDMDLGHCTGSAVWGSEPVSWQEYLERTGQLDIITELSEGGNGSTMSALQERVQQMPSVSLPSAWAVEEVADAREAGLIPKAIDGAYQTDITREEFCQLMARLLTVRTGSDIAELLEPYDLSAENPFVDTDNPEIAAMNALGIVNGVGNNCFDPLASITREEAAVMLARVAAKFDGLEANSEAIDFSDQEQISTWAKEAVDVVSSCMSSGGRIMNGTGENRFSPKESYTREQSIMTSLRLYRFIGDADFTNSGRKFSSLLPYCYVGGYKLHYGEYRDVNLDVASLILRPDGTADYCLDTAPTTEYESELRIRQYGIAWEVDVIEDYGTWVPVIWFKLEDTTESPYDGRQGYTVVGDDRFEMNDKFVFQYTDL